MPTTKTRIVLRIFGILFVTFLAWVTWANFQLKFQPRERPNISFKLLGYTNDTDGTRLAMFTITNLSVSKIFVYLPIGIADPESAIPFNKYMQWHSTLRSGASARFAIPPPTNQSQWRGAVYVYNDLGASQVLQRLMTGSARYMPWEIQSDWIDSDK